MKNYSFEKLESWQHARPLAAWTYKTTKNFPAGKKFGLVSQMRRAVIAVASNLAEITSRKTKKEQAHFSTMSSGSTIALLNDLVISRDLQTVSDELYIEERERTERQTLLIAGLRKSQQAASKPSNHLNT